jgi:DNA replication initiation complex subunit (GINS family)
MPDHYTLLLDWRRAEGSARGLAKLPHDFVPTTQAYLAEARRVFETEVRENPSGKKGEVARQTYQRASQVARDIVEARMTKILSQAFQASVGGSRDLPNALPEERELFDALGRTLRAHRQSVAPYLDPTGPTPAPPVRSPPPPDRVPAAEPRAPSAPAAVVVRVLKDGRPVEVGGETIDLRKEDVLTLPPETARILIEAKVAEKVERAEPPPTA